LYLWHAEIVATFGQKKAAFFTLFYQSKTVSSQFLFLAYLTPGRDLEF